jgi:hypothetical protein
VSRLQPKTTAACFSKLSMAITHPLAIISVKASGWRLV